MNLNAVLLLYKNTILTVIVQSLYGNIRVFCRLHWLISSTVVKFTLKQYVRVVQCSFCVDGQCWVTPGYADSS